MKIVISAILMKNIAIVCDSSVSFTEEEIKEYKVYVIPNLIMHDNKTFHDQVDIKEAEVLDLLRDKVKLTTSQANLGTIIDTFKDIKNKSYDYIYILTLASVLSGVHNSFSVAAEQAELENYEIIDTHSVAGPVQQGVRAIRQLNHSGKSLKEISEYLKFLFENQVSYLFPKSLDQIVASGRLSKAAGKVVSLLKIKPVVYFTQTSKSIDILGVSRTNKKAFEKIIKDFEKNNIRPEDYDLYLLDSDAKEQMNSFKDSLFNQMGKFNYHSVNLPAVLALHAGVGAIAIQWCPKIPQ